MVKISRDQASIVFILAICLLVVFSSLFLWSYLKTDPIEENMKDDQVMKILFVLKDRDGSALSTNVLFYYPATKKAAVFDVPGNTGQIWASLGRVAGIDNIYSEKGIVTYCKEISNLIDLDIPFYVEIDTAGFSTMVDLLGGIRVFLSSPVDQKMNNGERYLLPSGAITLDGEKIYAFLHFDADNDVDGSKEERKQNVFVSFLTSMAENRNKMISKKNFPLFYSCMKSNIFDEDLYNLFSHITNMNPDSITVQSIIGSSRIVDGQTLLFPYMDGNLVKDVVKQKIRMLIKNDDAANRRVYVLEVLNGTYKQGLARNASLLLQNAGYDLLQIGNADRMDYEHTVIINHIGNKDVAASLGEFINCYNIIDEDVSADENAADVDFTVILGNDWDGRYVRGGFGKEESSK